MALCVVDEKGEDRGKKKESMWCHWKKNDWGVWCSMAVCGEPTLVVQPPCSANDGVVGVCSGSLDDERRVVIEDAADFVAVRIAVA
jgi:hypothetical protein